MDKVTQIANCFELYLWEAWDSHAAVIGRPLGRGGTTGMVIPGL